MFSTSALWFVSDLRFSSDRNNEKQNMKAKILMFPKKEIFIKINNSEEWGVQKKNYMYFIEPFRHLLTVDWMTLFY